MLRSVLWIKSKTKKSSDMEDRYDIGVDIGEGKDYSVATLFKDGKYRPIAVCDTISFGSDVGHSGYVGAEAGEYTFSAEVVDVPNDDFLKELMGIGCPKRFEDDFAEFADEVSRGLSRVMTGVDEEYTTPKCGLMVEATDKSVYYPNVSATFRKK